VPGVFRPYTLVDVLGTINGQSTQQTGDIINGLGSFAETDEQATVTDKAVATAQLNPTWDNGTWGTLIWN